MLSALSFMTVLEIYIYKYSDQTSFSLIPLCSTLMTITVFDYIIDHIFCWDISWLTDLLTTSFWLSFPACKITSPYWPLFNVWPPSPYWANVVTNITVILSGLHTNIAHRSVYLERYIFKAIKTPLLTHIFSIVKMSFLPSTKEGTLSWKSPVAEWLKQTSLWHELYCHDLKVISLNLSQAERGVRSTSVLSCTWVKNIFTLRFSAVTSSIVCMTSSFD